MILDFVLILSGGAATIYAVMWLFNRVYPRLHPDPLNPPPMWW